MHDASTIFLTLPLRYVLRLFHIIYTHISQAIVSQFRPKRKRKAAAATATQAEDDSESDSENDLDILLDTDGFVGENEQELDEIY